MASIFADCNSLASFTIGNSVSDIGDWVFYGCISLTSVTIPNSVINIGKYAFSACRKLTSIAIPNSVTNIGGFAFSDCTHLGSVTVGSSVDTIGGYAFSWCLRVTGVYFTGNAPSLFPLGSDVFDIESHTTVYYLPNTKGWELTLSGRSHSAVESTSTAHHRQAWHSIKSIWIRHQQPSRRGGSLHEPEQSRMVTPANQHINRRLIVLQRSSVDELSQPFLSFALAVRCNL